MKMLTFDGFIDSASVKSKTDSEGRVAKHIEFRVKLPFRADVHRLIGNSAGDKMVFNIAPKQHELGFDRTMPADAGGSVDENGNI